ncbi:kinase-like domain-containing protein [Absidia repens]|uniref:Kinase-like domain-containing protein n=1 Tax=Absidia repens TaxID=90262 RepID=A0A1X2IF24_9FUNG|nr:kinase-like domain-containing protein [Absidia repens]
MTIMASSGENNWKVEFYKNGYPDEVIVIEDSPTPPSTPLTQEPSYSTSTSIAQTPVSNHMLPPAASTRSKRALRDQEEHRAAQLQRQQLFQLQQQQLQQQRKRRQQHLPTSPVATPAVHKKRRKDTNAIQGPAINNKVSVRIPSNVVAAVATTKSSPIDDKNGYFIFRPNEYLTKRYKMMRILGQGTFGKVIECFDRILRRRCAIKVIRSIHKYREASVIEIRVLDTLRKHDPSNVYHCIHLNEWFDYENHICMVFELLGPSVFDFLKANHFKPFSLRQIQQLAKQIFTSVGFLHRLKLVHTDLKPENILLVDTEAQGKSLAKSAPVVLKSTEIRLIDFGSATFEQEYHSAVVSTRHYRAPEIILALGWSYPCDIWSIGCMLVEFLTGDALFQTHDNLEHLAMMEAVIGQIPSRMIYKSMMNKQNYFEKSKLRYPTSKTTQQSINYVKSLHTLDEIVSPALSTERAQLLDLLKQIFTYDPHSRITASEALRHPFFQHNI